MLALPLGAYWFAVLSSLGLFTGLVATLDSIDREGGALLASFWISTVGGLSTAQALMLIRLRPALILLVVALGMLLGWNVVNGQLATLGEPHGSAQYATLVLFAVLLLGPFFVACGVWSLSSNSSILAAWAPLVWTTASILFVTNNSNAIEKWHAGEKWSIWTVFTAPILGLGVVMVIAYLAACELFRLHRWRHAAIAPGIGVARPESSTMVARAFPGCGTIGVVLLLALVLTTTSALVSPYLWRTHPGDRDGSGGERAADEQPRNHGRRAPAEHSQGNADDGSGIDADPISEMAQEAARQALLSLLMMALIVFLALIGLLVFGPPLRRMLLVAHLRRPFWPVPPTQRVRQHWRMVEIALADLGVNRVNGDSAQLLVQRAISDGKLLDPEALLECAAITDRVQYGLGLQPDDASLARRTADMTYQSAWNELSELQKLRAMYRIL